MGALVLRRWPIILVLLVLGAAGGGVAGTRLAPTYDAQARLAIGPSARNAQTLSASLDATSTLAKSYAEIGQSRPAIEATADALGVSAVDVFSRLNVEAVTDSPLLDVTASGDSREAALALARAGTEQTVAVVRRQTSSSSIERRQLAEYREAASDAIQARARLRQLRDQRADGRSDITSAEVDDAAAASQAAELELSIAGDAYTSTRQNAQGVAELSVFDPARITGDNRTSLIGRAAFAGAVAGGVVGLLIALALASRSRRRALRLS